MGRPPIHVWMCVWDKVSAGLWGTLRHYKSIVGLHDIPKLFSMLSCKYFACWFMRSNDAYVDIFSIFISLCILEFSHIISRAHRASCPFQLTQLSRVLEVGITIVTATVHQSHSIRYRSNKLGFRSDWCKTYKWIVPQRCLVERMLCLVQWLYSNCWGIGISTASSNHPSWGRNVSLYDYRASTWAFNDHALVFVDPLDLKILNLSHFLQA